MPTKTIDRDVIARTGSVPSGYRLIQDTYPLQVRDIKQVVNEATGSKKPVLRITGVFQKADEQNQNGRIYPVGILREAVEALQEDLPKRGIMGEYDHPSDAKIHLDRVSHLITKVWMEGRLVYGEAEVIEGTDCGRNLAALLRSGVQVGISSRGVGDMEVVNENMDDEHYVVQEGYRFVTWDVVGEPSVHEATLSVMESKNRNNKQGIITRSKMRQNDPEHALLEEINRSFNK